MSFSYGATGSRDETVDSLQKIGFPEKADGLGEAVRDLLVKHLSEATSEAYDGKVIHYRVEAHGHSGPGAILNCTVLVKGEYPYNLGKLAEPSG